MREREQAKDEALNTFVKFSVVEVAARHGISPSALMNMRWVVTLKMWWSIEGTVGGARNSRPQHAGGFSAGPSALHLHPMLFPRAMTCLEIRTVVINQSSRLFPTPVLLLHVTIKLEMRTSPVRDPTAQRTPVHLCLHPAEGATGQGPLYLLCLSPVSSINLGSTALRRVARPRTAQGNHSEFQDKLVETPS